MPSGISISRIEPENSSWRRNAPWSSIAQHLAEPLEADEHAGLGAEDVLHRVVHHGHQRHDRR